MLRSRYTWRRTGRVLTIVDQNGQRSVTNDVERVIADLVERGVPGIDDLVILYRDSMGAWCGIETFLGRFSRFVPVGRAWASEQAATEVLLRLRDGHPACDLP